MKVLVTGGAGFIGSNLANACAVAGDEVIVVDDLSSGKKERIPEIELVEGDVAAPEAWEHHLEGVEVVHHLAARRAVLRSVDDPIGTDRANTLGTLAVLKAARDKGVRRVVVTSSSSVYGGTDVRPTPETTPLSPRSPYAVSKLAGEHYARVFAELFDLETVILRPFNVYGPGQPRDGMYSAVLPAFIEAVMLGQAPEVFGDGKQTRDFSYVDDVSRAFRCAASAPAAANGRAYNVAGGGAVSLLDLLELVRAETGLEVEPAFGPPRAGDVRHTLADISAADQDLGWTPAVRIEEGVRRTVEWWRSTQT